MRWRIIDIETLRFCCVDTHFLSAIRRFPFAYHVQAQSREQPAILPASMYEGREIFQVDRYIF
jgi:hypothetical protein